MSTSSQNSTSNIMEENISEPTAKKEKEVAEAKILHAQNEKLNASLFKMRHLVSRADVERQQAFDELQAVKQQNDELRGIFQQMEDQIRESKKTVAFYQEQIDASWGAAKLIEELTEKNLELEEKVRLSESAEDDFDNLSRMFDEVSATYKQSEKEHGAEIERLDFKIEELKAESGKSDEMLRAAESLINKFRRQHLELKEKIQQRDDQILRLQEEVRENNIMHSIFQYTINLNDTEAPPDYLYMKKVYAAFEAEKEFKKKHFELTVRYELTQLELEYSLEHVKYLEAFLPENFSKAGGDNDLLLTHLAFPKIAAKAKLLMELLVQKYPHPPGVMRCDQVRRFVYSLQALFTIVRKLHSISKTCSVERLSKLAVQEIEIAQHEKHLDQYFELLLTNRMDENTSVENIDRATSYFQKVCSIHLSADGFDTNEYVSNIIAKFQVGFRWIPENTSRLELALDAEEDNEISAIMAQLSSVIKNTDVLAIRANNCIPKDKDIILTAELSDMLFSVISDTDKITKALHLACSYVASRPIGEVFTTQQMLGILHYAVEKVFGSIQAFGSLKCILNCAKNIHRSFEEFSLKLEKGELEKSKPEKEAVFSPVITRAQARKENAAKAENLQSDLKKKENEVLELNKLLKSSANELVVMGARLDIAEKKLSDSSGDSSDDRLENKYRELQQDCEKMKEQYEEIIKSRNDTITELETEAKTFKTKGKQMSMQRIMDFVSPSHYQTTYDGAEASGKVNQVNKRMAALLLQFNKLKVKQDEEDILGLPELKVPEVVAGPYGAHTKTHKFGDDVSSLQREARTLQKQFGRMLIEPLNHKGAYNASLAAYQERVERLHCQVQSAYARVMAKKFKPDEALFQ